VLNETVCLLQSPVIETTWFNRYCPNYIKH